MILEGEFFSGVHLRWNLGWPTPNYSGAFLVTLLALAFVFSTSRLRWVALATEVVGFFLLAKTYSRGAIVAWGLAWLFGFVASRGWRDSAQRMVWVSRVVVLVLMMIVVGFGWNRADNDGRGVNQHGTTASDGPTKGRATEIMQSGEAPAAEDGSVVNRLALWRGGLKMIAAAPLTGWGTGESGRIYMNWYQDVDRDEVYATMVNSYLHVAVEHGLLVFVVVFWIGAWLLLVAWRGAHNESASPVSAFAKTSADRSRLLQMAAGASLVAWAVANVFTTLWIEPKLWIVPAVAALVLVWNAWKNSGIRPISLAAVSLAIAVFAAGAIYSAGRWLLGKQAIAFIPGTNGSVMLASAGSTGAVWHAWPDPTVLGLTPGKEFRRWLETGSANVRLVVHRSAPPQSAEAPAGATGMLLFGRQAERIGANFPPDCRELWLIHPTVRPLVPRKSPKLSVEMTMITVVLPG